MSRVEGPCAPPPGIAPTGTGILMIVCDACIQCGEECGGLTGARHRRALVDCAPMLRGCTWAPVERKYLDRQHNIVVGRVGIESSNLAPSSGFACTIKLELDRLIWSQPHFLQQLCARDQPPTVSTTPPGYFRCLALLRSIMRFSAYASTIKYSDFLPKRPFCLQCCSFHAASYQRP